MLRCHWCNRQFHGSRIDQKYCSIRCRNNRQKAIAREDTAKRRQQREDYGRVLTGRKDPKDIKIGWYERTMPDPYDEAKVREFDKWRQHNAI